MAVINRTITILSGGTESEIVEALELAPAVSVLIIAPATMPEAVVLQVAESPAGTFTTLQTDGADVALAAGKATQLTVMGGAYWRLKAGGAAGADRAFRIIVNRIGDRTIP